jgi:hypothetical protein
MMNLIYRPCSAETDSFPRINTNPSFRPTWFTKELCFKSFVLATIYAREYVNKITVLFDGEEGSFYNLFVSAKEFLETKYNIQFDLIRIYENDRIGCYNQGVLLMLNDCEDTYIVDDDYLHTSDSILKMARALPKYKLLTGYDHSDRYTRTDDISYLKIVDYDINSQHHWMTTESTCHSYCIHKNLIKLYGHILSEWRFLDSDRELWRHLHRHGVALWSPITGLTTHCNSLFLSPRVDWESLARDFSFGWENSKD